MIFPMPIRSAIALAILMTLVPLGHALAVDFSACNKLAPLEVSEFYGRDYRDPSPDNRKFLGVVEEFHFTPEVEQLISGATGSVLGDVSYVLRRYPNHHRALYTLIRYHRGHSDEFQFPPHCYLRRAVQYYPDDPIVYTLFGIYLHYNGDLQGALEQYQTSESLFSRSAELHYNMGLLYVDMENYSKARDHARRAYDLGYQLPGLRNKLEALGHWP